LLYGDFVVDDPEQGIKPGEERQYEYFIRDDHPAGTYWYHPHLHGSSAMQVGSGMAGMLIIEGPIDEVPEIAAATEKVFVFQAPIYDRVTGKLEDFGQVGNITVNEPPFVINGVRVPRLLMKSGEVQKWRFLNAATFKMLNLSPRWPHALYQYSHDGNRGTLKPVAPLPLSAFDPPIDPPNPWGHPAAHFLSGSRRACGRQPDQRPVQAGCRAPTSCGRSRSKWGAIRARNNPAQDERRTLGDIVAEVVVVNVPFPMNLPTGPLPVTPFLDPITDQGGAWRVEAHDRDARHREHEGGAARPAVHRLR
jgi:hypothetical protein